VGLGEIFYQLPNRSDLVRIQADSRFIQNDQFRLMHQGISQSDSLTKPFGKVADDAAGHLG